MSGGLYVCAAFLALLGCLLVNASLHLAIFAASFATCLTLFQFAATLAAAEPLCSFSRDAT